MKSFKQWLLKEEEMSPKDAWAVLGLPYGASSEKVEIAYRALMSKNHPDLNPAASALNVKRINQAREVLQNFSDFSNHVDQNRPIINSADGAAKNYGSERKVDATEMLIKSVESNLSTIISRSPSLNIDSKIVKSLILLECAFLDLMNRLSDGPSTNFVRDYIESPDTLDNDANSIQKTWDGNSFNQMFSPIKKYLDDRGNKNPSRFVRNKTVGEVLRSEDIEELNDSIGHRLLNTVKKYSQEVIDHLNGFLLKSPQT